jgi:4-hydroxybenzoate polyprenyltransferase
MTRLKLFLALSRTTHGLLDFLTPPMAALLWLGQFPPLPVVTVGLFTAFCGYTAVYALNDLVDFRTDRLRVTSAAFQDDPAYLDRVFVHHPVAQGLVSFRQGLAWTVVWALAAFVGAWRLSPVCALIFVAGMLLEGVYCRMLEVTYLRVIAAGIVKPLGAIAAVYAVDPAVSPGFVGLLFLWLFCWEVGGQNVPADWYDLEEDRSLKFKTLPTRFGADWSSRIVLAALSLTLLFNPLVLVARGGEFPLFLMAGSAVAGISLLIIPAVHAGRRKDRGAVGNLFGRASFYPAGLLIVVLMDMALKRWGG